MTPKGSSYALLVAVGGASGRSRVIWKPSTRCRPRAPRAGSGRQHLHSTLAGLHAPSGNYILNTCARRAGVVSPCCRASFESPALRPACARPPALLDRSKRPACACVRTASLPRAGNPAPRCDAGSQRIPLAGMASKPPLSDRNAAAATTADRTDRWVRKGEAGAAGPPDERKQLTVRTGRPSYGKRGRDAGPPRQQHRPRPPSPSRAKKSRPAPPPGNPPPREPTGQRARHKGALPKLAKGQDRRVGGVAPNGNPQCWYAPYETEEDPHRVAQRLKQVEYGKNSDGYKAYLAAVPKCALSPRCVLCVQCVGVGIKGGWESITPAHILQEVAEAQPAHDARRAPQVQQALLRRPPALLAPPAPHVRPAAGGEHECRRPLCPHRARRPRRRPR